MNQSRSLAPVLVLALFLLILAGLVWVNYHFARLNIFGEGFSIQWIAIQSLAKSGADPYSEQVTEQIRSTVDREGAFVVDRFPKYTSPLYSGVVISPFTLIGNKTLAHGLWMTAQLIAIFVMVVLCLRFTAWKAAWYSFLLFLFFTLFSYHVAIPWLDGGLSIWAAFFLALAISTISVNRNEVAGFFLALSAIQPQMVILPLIFILIWAISKKRTVLLLWFFITLILLSVAALFVVPDWVLQYVRLVYNFTNNYPPGSPGVFFSSTYPGLGKQLGWLTSGVIILVLLIEWVLALGKDIRWFIWTACLTIVLSQWIGIPTIPGNFIMLIIPLILICAMLVERWPRGGQWGAIIITGLLFVWEWAIFYLDITSSHPESQLNLIFPLPVILLLGIYWVRWWAVKPRRLLIEELRLSETS